MNRQHIAARFYLLAVMTFAGVGWIPDDSPAKRIYATYWSGDEDYRLNCIEQLIVMSDKGLPYLERIRKKEKTSWTTRNANQVQLLLIDAISRVGTDKAADALVSGARHAGAKIGKQDFKPAWTYALAKTGRKGLERLVLLAKETELTFAHKPDSLFDVFLPHRQTTDLAKRAQDAIAEVKDPAAAPILGQQIDEGFCVVPAFTALKRMKATGYTDKALRVWTTNVGGHQQQAAALGYLLAVDRQKYVGLLQEKLKALDVEVERLLENLADLRARGIRDFVSDVSIVRLVYELGGEPSANATLIHYINSRLWLRYQEDTVAYAVLALGLSRAPSAKEGLLPLLADATPLDAWIRTGPPFSRFMLDGTGRGHGIPMFVIATVALQELGDPTVIPELEKAAVMQDPWFKPLFDNATTALRGRPHAAEE